MEKLFDILGLNYEFYLYFYYDGLSSFSLSLSLIDNDHDGRLDGIQLLAGINICCTATFDEKAKLCFALFDFNLNATMVIYIFT